MIALASCLDLPEPDGDAVPLCRALEARGVEARVLAWDDPEADFTQARACVIRSTWNYVHKLDAFLAWAERCARLTALWNPLPIVRWNSHKGYLLQLDGAGIPVVPTRFVPKGARPALRDLVDDWEEVVVKPAVSAGSYGTVRADRTTLARAEGHLHRLATARDMLVQRYMPTVEGYGERSLVFIDGVLTHAVRKSPRFSGDAENVSSARVEIAEDEAALAHRVLAASPGPVLYARVDLVRGEDGTPQLMELELIEPSLFLDRAPAAVDRLAAAIARL